MRNGSQSAPALAGLLAFALSWTLTPAPAFADADEKSKVLVAAMIEAHGGMDRWTSAPSVAFTEQWTIGGEPGVEMRYVVEQGPRRVHAEVVGTDTRIGWDGEQAWGLHWDVPRPPRFLAQLNYYFLNLPWLTQDPGVFLEYEGRGPILGGEKEYEIVLMTFGQGVGDSPEDYYRLYIDPETHVLTANDYIVTYRAILPDGMTQSPEKTLVFESFEEVDGLTVPTAFTIYQAEDQVYASLTAKDWSFREPFDAALAAVPEGGVIDESQP